MGGNVWQVQETKWKGRRQASVIEGETGGGLSDESGEWHKQTAVAPGGSWLISTLSIHLSVNNSLLLLFPLFSSYRHLTSRYSISHSTDLLHLQYLTSQVAQTQNSSVLSFARDWLTQELQQHEDHTS